MNLPSEPEIRLSPHQNTVWCIIGICLMHQKHLILTSCQCIDTFCRKDSTLSQYIEWGLLVSGRTGSNHHIQIMSHPILILMWSDLAFSHQECTWSMPITSGMYMIHQKFVCHISTGSDGKFMAVWMYFICFGIGFCFCFGLDWLCFASSLTRERERVEK